jgi:hypothetical protein
MPTAWNNFVKKIYHEEKGKNPNFQFKDALKLASKRKGEMGKGASSTEEMPMSQSSMSKKATRRRSKSKKNKQTKSKTKKRMGGKSRRR